MNNAVMIFLFVSAILLIGFAVITSEPQGAAVKGPVIDVGGPKHWVERRYICDLPNRDDCVACCDQIKEWTKGPAIIMDYESCIFKVPPKMAEDSKKVWNNCIRAKAGLEPLEVPFEE